MNFLSNILREEGGFDYKKAIIDSIVILIRDIPDAKESGLLHLCEFIEDCEFTYLSTQVRSDLKICWIVNHLTIVCNISNFSTSDTYVVGFPRFCISWVLRGQKHQILANIFGISITE